MELGDENYLKLWQVFRKESLKEFTNVYDILKVRFDSYAGEAFYNDKIEAVVDKLEDLKLLEIDDGATIVNLGDEMPPALIKRSDGGTLYITRDLTALLYRHENYNFSKILYVVGNEQKLHFEQLKKVSYLMGYDFDLVHVNFGLVLIDGKKMSTRSGTNANLLTIIKEAILEAKNQILEKNPQLENIHDISKKIGVGAIIFNDLKNERNLDIDFDLENMLKFEGQTGPYVQYSSVRINSILKKETIKDNLIDYKVFKDEFYFELIKLVDSFVEIIDKARLDNSPSIIAKYLLALSQSFNRFYGKHKIIVDDKGILNANLALIKAVRLVLNEGLRLLGIDYLDEM
jgi:arginyl-tRNA synthetase